MLKCYKFLSLFCCAITLVNYAVYGQSTESDKISAYINKANQIGLFNGNILVIDHGKVVYKAAIGYADASKQIPLSTSYRFHIGSIAKEFDAVGIMMLKEEGKLSLDDKVSKFFPELPSWAEKISIKNLLQYTSGLPDVKWRTVTSDADNWKDLEALKQLDFEPGTGYAYNNNNTFLRRKIIEKVTGMTIKDFIEQKMLKPFGIYSGVVDPTDSEPLMAKSFNDNYRQDALIYPISGWVCLNIDDFNKWAACIKNFKIISAASTREILTPIAPGKQCGLGFGTMNGDTLLSHVHDGIALHYQALEVTEALNDRTIILLTNQRHDNVYDLNTAIEAILDGKTYEQPRKSILKEYQKQLDTISAKQALLLYHDLKIKSPEAYGFDNENTLNEIGYFYMDKNQLDDAVSIFEYNTMLFPASGNVYDSLGEAYNKKGDKQKALINYKKSVALDPTNSSAKEIIQGLEKQ